MRWTMRECSLTFCNEAGYGKISWRVSWHRSETVDSASRCCSSGKSWRRRGQACGTKSDCWFFHAEFTGIRYPFQCEIKSIFLLTLSENSILAWSLRCNWLYSSDYIIPFSYWLVGYYAIMQSHLERLFVAHYCSINGKEPIIDSGMYQKPL